jgi:isocitrate lyase
MAAYSELQEAEFEAEDAGYTATRHQREVGTSYFDAVATAVSAGTSSTTAMAGSTEADQFHDHDDYHYHDKHSHDDGLVHGHAWAVSSPER